MISSAVLARPSALALMLRGIIETSGLIAGEASVVGRIAVDEIARPWLRFLEVAKHDLRPLQGVAGPSQALGIANVRVLVLAFRRVELARLVDAVESIEASLVEIDEPCSNIQGFQRFFIAHSVIVGLAVLVALAFAPPMGAFVFAQTLHQRIHVGFHHLVGNGQVFVCVAQDDAFNPLGEGEESRTAAHERLPIGSHFVGEVLGDCRYQTALAPGPLDEGHCGRRAYIRPWRVLEDPIELNNAAHAGAPTSCL